MYVVLETCLKETITWSYTPLINIDTCTHSYQLSWFSFAIKGSRRSRSAPPSRANSEPSSSPHKSAGRWKDLPPRPKRHSDDGVEIKVYEVDDMDKIPNQRAENVKVRLLYPT